MSAKESGKNAGNVAKSFKNVKELANSVGSLDARLKACGKKLCSKEIEEVVKKNKPLKLEAQKIADEMKLVGDSFRTGKIDKAAANKKIVACMAKMKENMTKMNKNATKVQECHLKNCPNETRELVCLVHNLASELCYIAKVTNAPTLSKKACSLKTEIGAVLDKKKPITISVFKKCTLGLIDLVGAVFRMP
jgi:hypothetical protein